MSNSSVIYNLGIDTAKFTDQIRSEFYMCEGKLGRISDLLNGKDRYVGWFDKSSGYWKLKYKGRNWLLHRFIFLWANGYLPEFVDHIDRDVNNNDPNNLRACEYKGQNTINSTARSDNTSGYKGVTWHRGVGKWHSSVYKDGKRHYLGVFDSKEDAALVYNNKALELFGEFAVLNKIG